MADAIAQIEGTDSDTFGRLTLREAPLDALLMVDFNHLPTNSLRLHPRTKSGFTSYFNATGGRYNQASNDQDASHCPQPHRIRCDHEAASAQLDLASVHA